MTASEGGFWYLATPYTKHPRGRAVAFLEAAAAAAICFKAGIPVFAAIPHAHPISDAGQMATDYDTWAPINELMVGLARGVIVVRLDGWDESDGVKAEMRLCARLGKPIYFMDATGLAPRLDDDDAGPQRREPPPLAAVTIPKCIRGECFCRTAEQRRACIWAPALRGDFAPAGWADEADWYIREGIDIRDVIEVFGLDFNGGQVLKYFARLGQKPGNAVLVDLKKARVHIDRAIARAERVVAP